MARMHELSVKFPVERLLVGASFANRLAAGETILLASSSITAEDGSGDDVTDDIIESGSTLLSGATLYATLSGGDPGAEYFVTFAAATNLGSVYAETIAVTVRATSVFV